MDSSGAASRTAVLVCQGRAVAHGRVAVGRFDDPTASDFLRDREREVVELVRTTAVPADWRQRIDYEMVRGCAEVMVPRTVAIDDAVRESPAPQLVILGAGLDGRAWRMTELADITAFEVDHPASQQDKRDRVDARSPLAKSLRFVSVDLTRDRLDTALATAEHDPSLPTTWIWEGVVSYLTRGDVMATVTAISALSTSGSRLIVNYQTPALSAGLGRLAMRALTRVAHRPDPLAIEPHRSGWTPAAMRRLLANHAWTVGKDADLLSLAEGLAANVTQRRSLRNGRVLVAERRGPRDAAE